jgi:hypothetical chaperone protein
MSSSAPVSIGIDFGTSNTVVALAGPEGPARVLRFRHGGEELSTYITALCYWQEAVKGVNTIRHDGGPWAVDAFLTGLSSLRFIQSFKTFAASAAFKDTRIFGAKTTFEDLLATFLATVKRHAGLGFDGARVVMGRPVRFAGGAPDDGLAMARYGAALERMGMAGASYVYEPVGAAFFYARALERDSTVLVADFGGGTSDFSVIRFEGPKGARTARPLGHSGIGIAGDTFDYRIIDHIVSPRLGKHSNYVSFGKSLPLPVHFFANFARWNQLSMMKANGDLKELRDLARHAEDREALERFIEIIEYDLGFELYRAVNAAKRALSAGTEAEFEFREGGIDIAARITRAEFEGWIANDIARIAETVDQALATARLGTNAIDKVFLTGGSSLIPAIRQLFARRFGEARIVSGDQFESIAAGLALIGREKDLDRWTVG